MVESTSVGLPPQGYIHIKQSGLTKNHVTRIHGYHIAPSFILVRYELQRYKTLFIYFHRCCINSVNFVWARVRDLFNSIFEIKLDDTIFMQLSLSIMILQFLSLIFVHVWKIMVLRQSSVSLGCARVYLTIATCLIELRNYLCHISFSESLPSFPMNTTSLQLPFEAHHAPHLIDPEKSPEFTWAELLHMPIILTFKRSSAGVGSRYALIWALTFEISCQSGTVRVDFELGLSRVGSSVLGLII